MIDKKTEKMILIAQRNEITEYFIYQKLSQSVKNSHNKEILKRISDDELKHYNFWKGYTKKTIKPNRLMMWQYYFISRIFGLTFGLKLMEKGEELAQSMYEKLAEQILEAKEIIDDEDKHEQELINLIDEEKLKYIGSIVLGLNDALVELTGALAGFTLALNNTSLIAMTGLITGIAASLSMAASEYLSTKSEEGVKNPFRASVYTGLAYVFTTLLLIFPFLVFKNVYFCLGFTIFNAIVVIFVFNFYISVAKDLSFKERFWEMALISVGISGLTFVLGYFIRMFFGIEI